MCLLKSDTSLWSHSREINEIKTFYYELIESVFNRLYLILNRQFLTVGALYSMHNQNHSKLYQDNLYSNQSYNSIAYIILTESDLKLNTFQDVQWIFHY